MPEKRQLGAQCDQERMNRCELFVLEYCSCQWRSVRHLSSALPGPGQASLRWLCVQTGRLMICLLHSVRPSTRHHYPPCLHRAPIITAATATAAPKCSLHHYCCSHAWQRQQNAHTAASMWIDDCSLYHPACSASAKAHNTPMSSSLLKAVMASKSVPAKHAASTHAPTKYMTSNRTPSPLLSSAARCAVTLAKRPRHSHDCSIAFTVELCHQTSRAGLRWRSLIQGAPGFAAVPRAIKLANDQAAAAAHQAIALCLPTCSLLLHHQHGILSSVTNILLPHSARTQEIHAAYVQATCSLSGANSALGHCAGTDVHMPSERCSSTCKKAALLPHG